MVDTGEPLVSFLQIPVLRIVIPTKSVILALELHICPNLATTLEDCVILVLQESSGKEKRIRRGRKPHSFTRDHLQKDHTMQRSRYTVRLQPFSALCTTQPTLHAQCTQATLSATAMWLLCRCSNKGKRSLGVAVACAIERHTQICSKAAIQQAPLEQALVSLVPLGACVFSVWSHSFISPRRLSL